MTRYYSLSDNRLVSCDLMGPVELVIAPDEQELARMRDFGIGDHNVTSALDPDELARLEFSRGSF